MKVSTKIILGFGILISLMIAVLIYQVYLINDTQVIFRNLSENNFQALSESLQLMRSLDPIEEWTTKSILNKDPRYRKGRKEYEKNFTDRMQEIKTHGKSEKEQAEITRLSRFWTEFLENLARVEQELNEERPENLPSELTKHLEKLRVQTDSVYDATRQAFESEVTKSTGAAEQAQWISYSAAALALVLGFLVALFIVRSITEPLRHLTEGTRAIAEEKFFYRLDTSRKDEFSQVAKDFNTMTHRLLQLDQMKKDFVSHVSHELKAPLASMQETINMLLGEIPGPLTDKQKRLLELNNKSGSRLSSMIGNLLDLSRMEARVMEYELKVCDLAALVRTAVTESEARAREKSLRIEPDLPESPLSVGCDGDRIIQVVGNVLGNAIKFSPSGSCIRVHVYEESKLPARAPQDGKSAFSSYRNNRQFALVSVSDSGPGILDEHKEKIFQKFYQVRQGNKVGGRGVGLGLAICRTIVEAHRGAIWVEDNSEGGSTFFILLSTDTANSIETHFASSPI